MPFNLNITLIIFSIILILVTSYVVKKGMLIIKYSLLWYCVSIIVLIPVFFSKFFSWCANVLGFETIASLMIAIVVGLLLLVAMALTIICSTQRRKITMLIQEVSMIKQKVEEYDRGKDFTED